MTFYFYRTIISERKCFVNLFGPIQKPLYFLCLFDFWVKKKALRSYK
nr:MAG TPA: hypothetical protein [Caudoviricetes sp.]